MHVHAHEDGNGRAQSSNLRKSEVNEDDAALHHVNAQVGVDASENQAGNERQNQEWQNFHVAPC